MKHFSRLLIYNSYNVNKRLLNYYKKYKFNKKHKFNSYNTKKNTHLHLYNEIIKRGAAEHITHELVPLFRVQLFQKLGGKMLLVILKKSNIFSFYIHGSILYLYFCNTLFISFKTIKLILKDLS